MGGSQSQPQVPEPLNIPEFRKLADPDEYYVIPEVPEKRKVTDFKFTIIFGVCLLLIVPFLIYSLIHADLDRFIHGYDKCGNVCGKKNVFVNGISCSGKDTTEEPLLEYRVESPADNYLIFEERSSINPLIPNKCVKRCKANFKEIFNRCYPTEDERENLNSNLNSKAFNKFLADLARDINKAAGYIVLFSLIGLGFSVGMLLLFRYYVAVVVWVILMGSLIGVLALTGLFWYLTGNNDGFRGFAIVFTILSSILICVLICMFKRIQLMIRLFKEAMKVIFGIPLILFEPLLTLIVDMILIVIFFYIFILLLSAGFLQPVGLTLYDYTPTGGILFTIWYHVILCVWMEQFLIGCQHMVISGSVSAYYFTRNKNGLGNPIRDSFYNLIRYHLGTVALGSLIITIIAVIKGLIRSFVNNRAAKFLVDCCLGRLETFLRYLSKNAYIQTAMHGQPFYKSGKRAARLLMANAFSAIAINSVGDFILCMAKLVIVLCTILMGVLMRDPTIENFWAAIVIGAIVAAIIADCFFAVFETAIDTIFICFCEDQCMNDGEMRPYYMSTEFMQYIEKIKKKKKVQN